MSKRCKHIEKDGFHHCCSYAFNLYKDGIEQGDLCDVHYWQDKALSARTRLADAALDKMGDNARELGLSYEQPECKYGNEPASCRCNPMDCQCEIDAFFEQPTTAPVRIYSQDWFRALESVRKPLTDEQIAEIAAQGHHRWIEFARAIEAAHGIKGNT